MNKLQKIGLLIPTLESGGAERVISITSRILSKAGYDIYIFLYDTDNISYDYSGELIDLKSKAGSNIFTKSLIRIKRIIKLSYYKYKYDLDLVISFLYSANVVNYYSKSKGKSIISCRGYLDYIEDGKKYSKMLDEIDSIIVQTERMKVDFINDYGTNPLKINTLYNPFDINSIRKKAIEEINEDIKSFINTHKTICTLGSFKKEKGYWHLIKSFSVVKESIPNAGLVFIGHNGEMEKEIKNMARTSGFKDDILFLGYQKNPFKYISNCDLYVCSSIYEGFPNSLVEAMACGMPVLSTDCKTGPREILSETMTEKELKQVSLSEYGILVPKLNETINLNIDNIDNSEFIMAEGIIKILKDRELLKKYSEISINRVDEFNMDKYCESLVEILEFTN